MTNFNAKINEAKKSMKKDEGFTLIELIVVMAIIAILVALAAPKFLGYTKDAKATALQQDAKIISQAAQVYNIDGDKWPDLSDKEFQKDFIKSTKNPIEEFTLITEGDYEGEVYHAEGTENKAGEKIHSNIKGMDGTGAVVEPEP